ncbi:hypothetical protein [Candidatus Cytomitobacter primus]|uniref:Uncharacterized protein n=1 Tax=Candidatus Cytomitobacter primus TaxID=2066024 RepID=A0A5C0UIU8_9PROT|nr:hypothetical protein [Candidatus Cytomitobacter primus]QEK38804.1 hypothetical protein FZC34_02735 [Candidatus Cytomitobacter primus]
MIVLFKNLFRKVIMVSKMISVLFAMLFEKALIDLPKKIAIILFVKEVLFANDLRMVVRS